MRKMMNDEDEAMFPIDMECNLGISSKCLEGFSWDGESESGYTETDDNDIMMTKEGWIVSSKDGACVCPACAAVCAACFTAL